MLSLRHLDSRLRARTIKAVQIVGVSAAVLVAIGAGDPTTRFSKIATECCASAGAIRFFWNATTSAAASPGPCATN